MLRGVARSAGGVMPVDEDLRILGSIAAGNDGAMDRLVLKYQSFVYFLALQIVKNPPDAEDVAQEVFYRVYRYAKKFRGDAKVKTWIYGITVNEARSRYRSAAKHWSALVEEASGEEVRDLADIEETILARETSETLHTAIDRLPEVQRTVVLMFYKEELSYQEITEILQIPMGTVKTHLYRAKNNLARLLREDSLVAEGAL